MIVERPYVWHASKFGHSGSRVPWTVSIGRPKHDMDWVYVAKTLPEAMALARTLVPKEVP